MDNADFHRFCLTTFQSKSAIGTSISNSPATFEDSTVEQIYKFESTEQGSKVTAL